MKEITTDTRCKILALYPLCPIIINEPGAEPTEAYIEGVDFYSGKVIAERVNYPAEWITLLVKHPMDIPTEFLDLPKNHLLDLARAQGYPTLYLDYSVEDLIELGIYKHL